MLPAIELTTSDKGDVVVPEWVMIFDAGELKTNDGRFFRNINPDAFIAATEARGIEPPVDINHGMERGSNEPAMGWVKELDNRDGQIWARIEWTEKGYAAVAAKEYRYLSPAFDLNEATFEILHLESLAVTNKPAFNMPALTTAKPKSTLTTNTETSMFTEDQLARMRKAYGLADDADADTILEAMDAAQNPEPSAEEKAATEKAEKEAVARQAEDDAGKGGFTADSPDPDKWVPRADYDVVVEAHVATKTGDGEASDEADVAAAIDAAVASGRIAPATKAYHTANCATKGGLAAFQKMVKAAPEIVPKRPTVAKAAKELGGVGLTAAQKKVCAQTGVSESDYAKTLASQNS